jgi:hypothetical protein
VHVRVRAVARTLAYRANLGGGRPRVTSELQLAPGVWVHCATRVGAGNQDAGDNGECLEHGTSGWRFTVTENCFTMQFTVRAPPASALPLPPPPRRRARTNPVPTRAPRSARPGARAG